ncbi:MAG TPA: mechanosensitive ion channel domain-containing protein [Chthoniobacterales bacterium]
MTGIFPQQFLDDAGAALGKSADRIGSNAHLVHDIIFGISASRLIASGILLGATALLAWLVIAVANAMAGNVPEAQAWPRAIVATVRKPVAVLLAIFGTYIALGASVSGISDADVRHATQAVLTGFLNVLGMATVLWLVALLAWLAQKKLERLAVGIPSVWTRLALEIAGHVLRVSIPLIALILMVPLLDLPGRFESLLQKMTAMGLIGGIAGLIIRSTLLFQKAMLAMYTDDMSQDLSARKVYTQISVVTKIIIAIVSIVALGCMLMVFDVVRQAGASILASAGIAGIVLGFAAQKTLGNFFAGMQIAFSQPIRHNDAVLVEGEFGFIEEINLTHVVVRLWDLRRMVLPITYFVEKPFQNWTLTGSRLIGAVVLNVDYTIPVDEIRAELRRIVEASALWDRDVCALQVTDAKENTLEVRCLATAADAAKTFDLRCEIREKLVKFIQERMPQSLPHRRTLTRAPLD